jgi:LAO/AO transport system kinase
VIELADLLVVTKADGALAGAAAEALAEYRAALGLLRPGRSGQQPQALACSALTGTGLEELWQEIERARAARQENGAWQSRRAEQAGTLLALEVATALLSEFRADARIAAAYPEIQIQLSEGKLTPSEAARRLLALRAPK